MTRNTELLSIEKVKELLENADIREGSELMLLLDDLIIMGAAGEPDAEGWASVPSTSYLTGPSQDPDWAEQVLPLIFAAPDLAHLCLSLAAQLQQEREARERVEKALRDVMEYVDVDHGAGSTGPGGQDWFAAAAIRAARAALAQPAEATR